MLAWESLHSHPVGGVAQHVTELAAAMERIGHEVHVFTRMAPGQRHHDWIDGVRYHRCPYPGHPEFVDDVNNMCRAFVERMFIVEDMVGEFDIVHAHDWLAANAMIWIKQGRARRSILTIHSTEYARCGNTFPGGRSQRVRDQERAGTYWADSVICVSNATRDEIMWMYEVPEYKTAVVYNGVSANRFGGPIDVGETRRRYDIGPMDPTILFCGRLEWQKGPDLMVEALPSVLHHHPNAKFVFAGDGSMRHDIERRARAIGAGPAGRFLGYRNGTEIADLFKLSDGVCVPSRNEPFGIVILEAWSAEKPVVVTDVGGPGEIVVHDYHGLKISPTPDSIAWGMGTLLSDFDRARWMGANGRRAVLNGFGWDAIAVQTLTVYGFPPLRAAEPAPERDRKETRRTADVEKSTQRVA
jgi:glycosyltransferase involved in cell wall biosynthesis